MPKGSPPDCLQPREAPLWSREAALWACLPRSLRGVSHTVYGKLPGGSGNGRPILAHLGAQGTIQLPARQPGQSKTQYLRSACTVPHIVPMSFGRHTWAGVLVLLQGCSELIGQHQEPVFRMVARMARSPIRVTTAKAANGTRRSVKGQR